jgi:hypothetical protein
VGILFFLEFSNDSEKRWQKIVYFNFTNNGGMSIITGIFLALFINLLIFKIFLTIKFRSLALFDINLQNF